MAAGRGNEASAYRLTDYQQVAHDEAGAGADSSDRSPMLDDYLDAKPSYRRSSRLVDIISSSKWFFCSLVLLAVVVLQAVDMVPRVRNAQPAVAPQQTVAEARPAGLRTEFDAVQPAIETVEKRFTSALRADADGELVFDWQESGPRYSNWTGASWHEVGKAWEDLLHGRYVGLTDDEVSWLNSDSFNPALETLGSDDNPEGYYGGPDMLHSLHCLDSLRQSLYPEHYHHEMYLDGTQRQMHLDHCVEQLRQAILCHGDMTPVTLKPVRHRDGRVWAWLGETERTHTCRDGAKLREWWTQRGQRTGYLHF